MSAKRKPKPKPSTQLVEPDVKPAITADISGANARILFSAIKIVAAFASREEYRPVLCAVRIRSDATKIVLEATDSYRLARLELARLGDFPEIDTLVDARWLTANLPKGRIHLADEYQMSVAGGRFAISDLIVGTETSIPVTGGELLSLDEIIEMATKEPPEDAEFERAFNPKLLATIFAAAAKFGDDSRPLRIRHLDPIKPCRFDVVADDGTLTMLLMPVRIA